jgi:hypothetical protein
MKFVSGVDGFERRVPGRTLITIGLGASISNT